MSRSRRKLKSYERVDYWSRRGGGINPAIAGKFTKKRTSKRERAEAKKETMFLDI